jgi:23S rRNA (pseudouridine1915-N3)-methyltransferase
MQMITILAVGKIKEMALADLILEYQKRLKPYILVKIVEVPAEPFSENNKARAKQKEGEKIRKFLEKQKNAKIIIMDEKGESFDSLKFADQLAKENSPLIFVIGGALGLTKELMESADQVIALSKLTFTHEIARLLLVEQIYRSVTIINKKTYHY